MLFPKTQPKDVLGTVVVVVVVDAVVVVVVPHILMPFQNTDQTDRRPRN